MSVRTAIKSFGRRVNDVRYVGRLARISAAVWRMPYTAASLNELKESVGQLALAQQQSLASQSASQPLPESVNNKLDAIAEGYGSALNGLQKAMREIESQINSIRMEADKRVLSLNAEIAKQRQEIADLRNVMAAESSEARATTDAQVALLKDALSLQEQEIGDLRNAMAVESSEARATTDAQVALLKDALSLQEQEIGDLRKAINLADSNALAEANQRTAKLEADIAPLKEQNTALTNTISSIAEKMGWISVDNDNIRARLEFIRTEVMFELRKQMRLTQASTAHKDDPDTAPRIINVDKVNAGGPKRLNLGSGHIPKEGYINVDFRAVPGVDVVGDVSALQFEPGTIDGIFASHLIEHFPAKALHDVILPHWRDLLRPGGEIVLIAPDGEAMLRAYNDGTFNFEEVREVLYGGQEYEGDFHFNMLSPSTAEALLTKLGFTGIRVDAAGRRNGNCLEFQIYAEKPLS